MPRTPGFAKLLKDHLCAWARDPARGLQTDGKHGWVLAKQQAGKNYFADSWGNLINGKEHRWGHALNSSQAFAVNLFAPAAVQPAAAKVLWNVIWPNNAEAGPESVSLEFEYSGPVAGKFCREFLGELKQVTQIDVSLRARFAGGVTRYFLIEVKLRETEFGSCRGAREPGTDCLSLAAVLKTSQSKCWMERVEGRKYWQVLRSAPRPLLFDAIGGEACPWRGGLYQVMRNWAFGQALVQAGEAQDFRVGLCVHASNDRALVLADKVAGRTGVFEAFNALTAEQGLLRIEPAEVVNVLEANAPKAWGGYMRSRYLLRG